MKFYQLNSNLFSIIVLGVILINLSTVVQDVNSAPALIATQIEPYKEIHPEFVAPIKNITSRIGTNADFACIVKNLGSSRIMWFKRQGDKKEVLLGVNGLKISKSPKISLSVIPSSGLVTESILYIYNIDHEDVGEYICGVNTNPVITQSGTLDIKVETETKRPHSSSRRPPDPTRNLHSSHPEQDNDFGVIRAVIIDNDSDKVLLSADDSTVGTPGSSSSTKESGIFCIDLPKLWTDSKQEAQKLYDSIWDKIRRYF